jgi:hypothetical protein
MAAPRLPVVDRPGLAIVARGRGAGFHIRFENGWTASVQFGAGNYGDNRWVRSGLEHMSGSGTAECAAWNLQGDFRRVNDGDPFVRGRQTPDQVLAFLNEIARLPPCEAPAEKAAS